MVWLWPQAWVPALPGNHHDDPSRGHLLLLREHGEGDGEDWPAALRHDSGLWGTVKVAARCEASVLAGASAGGDAAGTQPDALRTLWTALRAAQDLDGLAEAMQKQGLGGAQGNPAGQPTEQPKRPL